MSNAILVRATNLIATAAIAVMAMLALASNSVNAQDTQQKDSSKNDDFSVTVHGPQTDAGLIVSARATAKELGLPLYPGAVPHKDKNDESPAANLGLWGNSFGFKLVVLKMESKDSPQKVAEYYQKALAKYGRVLDCTSAPETPRDKDDKSSVLTCGDDKPEKQGLLFKVGTKAKQHIVAVQPNGTGTLFQLVYIEDRSSESKPPAESFTTTSYLRETTVLPVLLNR
jgi:hypothetical protein